MCICIVSICACESKCLQRPDEDPLQLELQDSCKSPHVGAENRSWVLSKMSVHACSPAI